MANGRVKFRLPWKEYLLKLKSKNQNEAGQELVSSIPMQPPIGFKKQPSMVEHIREVIRSEMLARQLAENEEETFDEADDFDVPDDPLPPQGYEDFEPDFEPSTSSPSRATKDGQPAEPAVGGDEPPSGTQSSEASAS